MKITTGILKSFLILIFLFTALFAKEAFAQEVPQTKELSYLRSLNRARAQNDSLKKIIDYNNNAYNILFALNKRKDLQMDSLDQELASANTLIGSLENTLSSYKGLNLKLDQSNRILIIFNSVVGLLLLSTLIWFLRNIGKRRINEKIVATSSVPVINVPASPVLSLSNHQYFENKLEHLERLGKLKEKGFLNDEEFSKEKHRVLGSNGL